MKPTVVLWLALAAVLTAPAIAQPVAPAGDGTAVSEEIRRQEYARAEFQKLVDEMLKVAALLEKTEPDAARAILQAVQKAQGGMVEEDMQRVVQLLQEGMLLAARNNQLEVVDKLKEILDTLRSGSIDLGPRLRQIEQWKQFLQRVQDLQRQEAQRAQATQTLSNAQALSQAMAELGRRLEGVVQEQKQLRDHTGEMPDPTDPAVAKLNDLRLGLEQLRARQAELTGATARLPIGQLPGATKLQQDITGRAAELAEELDKLAKDPAAAKGAEDLAAAARAAALAKDEMDHAGGELGQSNKTTAAQHQQQAASDLDDARRAVEAALAKMGAGSQADELAKTQSGLARKTGDLAKDYRDLLRQAGQSGQSGQQERNLDQAARKMDEASGHLRGQDRDRAQQAQKEALEQMEADLAELAQLRRRMEEQAKNPDFAGEREKQDRVQADTDDLARRMEKDQSGSPAPGQKATQGAAQSMGKASQSLGQSSAGEANRQQQEAIEQLKLAQEELAEQIRQAEEMLQADALKKVDAMLRTILNAQLSINRQTLAVYPRRREQGYDRPEQLKLGELSDSQGRQAEEVSGVVKLIDQEGTTAIFPSVLEQVRQDMAAVQGMLKDLQAGPLTQSLQEQIAATLKELIDALQQEMARRQENPSPGGQPPPGGQPSRQPLVPPVAELKMLKGLQVQIRDRTLVLDAERASGADELVVRLQHKVLSDRQARLQELTVKLAEKIRPAGGQGPPPAPQP